MNDPPLPADEPLDNELELLLRNQDPTLLLVFAPHGAGKLTLARRAAAKRQWRDTKVLWGGTKAPYATLSDHFINAGETVKEHTQAAYDDEYVAAAENFFAKHHNGLLIFIGLLNTIDRREKLVARLRATLPARARILIAARFRADKQTATVAGCIGDARQGVRPRPEQVMNYYSVIDESNCTCLENAKLISISFVNEIIN
jgi:hypothetical protein